jgi:hypothetical protein
VDEAPEQTPADLGWAKKTGRRWLMPEQDLNSQFEDEIVDIAEVDGVDAVDAIDA